MDKSVIAAFEERFIPEPNSGCWLWIGNRFSEARGGYGCFTMRPAGILSARAHRVAFAIYCHKITSEQHVLHRCDNPVCVNPEHLFLGDQLSNMADRDMKRRQNRGENHGRGKLTEQQAIAIKADSRPYIEIAEDFGISAPTVSNIKCGRSWSHLGMPNRRYNPTV